MKKLGALFAVVVVLALDWAALHDILKANEPDLIFEYMMVIGSIPLLLLFAAIFKPGPSKTSAV